MKGPTKTELLRRENIGGCRFAGAAAQVMTAAALAAFLASACGCSLVGVGIGSVIDNRRRDNLAQALELTRPGTQLDVRLRDGSTFRGRFLRVEPMPVRDYTPRYAAWHDSIGSILRLPALGAEARLATPDRDTISAEFAGFTRTGVRLSGHGRPAVVEMGFQDIEAVEMEGRRWASASLAELGRSSAPCGSIVWLRTPHDTISFAVDEVADARGPAPRAGKVTLGLIGACVDAYAVMMAVAITSTAALFGPTY